MAPRIGFLHTAAVHVDTFTRLLAEAEPRAIGVHVLDESLLADARRLGTTDPALLSRIEIRLRQAAAESDAVLCTCSTLGAVAEAMSSRLGLPVVRVDRPMAAAAVQAGRRIGIVAAVESTVGPTRQLLEEEAEHRRAKVTLIDLPCPEAWEAFEAGDIDRYLTQVAEHVDRAAPTVDVVVLAQASMAGAVDRCSTRTPVLTSPRAGVAAVLAASTMTGGVVVEHASMDDAVGHDEQLLDRLREITAMFDGCEESVLQGRPLFHVSRRRFAIFNGESSPPRPRWAAAGRSIHFLSDPSERDALLQDRRFVPSPHHGDRGWLAIRLDSMTTDWAEIAELLEAAHQQVARRR